MAVAIANTQTYENTGTGSTQTQTGYTPAAGSNRILVVRIHGLRTSESGAFTVDTVTFGGVSMTQAVTVSTTSSSRTYRTAIWYLINPSGSSGDVVATFSHASNSTIIATATLTGAAQTSPVISTDSDYNDGTISYLTLQLTGTIPSGSIGIYAATTHCNNNPTFSWTGPFTEEYDIRTASNTSTEVAGSGGWRDTYLYSEVLPEPTQAWPKCGAAVGFLPAAAAQTITASSISTTETFGSGAFAPGAVNVAPTAGIASAASVPSPTTTPGAVNIAPAAGIASGQSVPSATVATGAANIAPSGIASLESIGAVTLTPGAVTVAPNGMATAESVPSPAATVGGATLSPNSIGSTENIPGPTLTAGGVTVAPSGIGTAENVPSVTVEQGALSLAPDSIITAESVPSVTLTPGPVAVTPNAIPSDENVNGVTIAHGGASIVADSITSAENVPDPTLADHRWTATITNGADDSLEDSAGLIYLNTTSGNVDASSPLAAFYIHNPSIPAGATIVRAFMRLYVFAFGNPKLNIKAQATHSPPPLSATTNDISDRTLTDAGAPWSATGLALNQYHDSASFAAAFQEVIDLPGWTEGTSDILIVMEDDGTGGHIRFQTANNATDRPQLVVDYVLGDTAQTITVTGIPSGESVAEAVLSPGPVAVDPVNGIESLEVVAAPNLINPQIITDAGEIASEFYATGGVLSQGGPLVVVDDGIATAEAVGEPAINVPYDIIITDGIGTAESAGLPVVAPADYPIVPDSIETVESVGQPDLTGLLFVAAGSVVSAEALGDAAILPGGVTIVTVSMASGETVAVPLVTTGEKIIIAESAESAESVPAPDVVPGVVAVAPDGVASLEFVAGPDVAALYGIQVASIAGAESVGQPAVTPGVWLIEPLAVPTAENVPGPALAGYAWILPEPVESAESIDAPGIIPGGVTIEPGAIESTESWPVPALGFGPVEVAPVSIGSGMAWGVPALAVGPVTIAPAGILSAEVFGLLLVMSRFLPAVNIYRVPGGARVFVVTGRDRIYRATFKPRVYVVEE